MDRVEARPGPDARDPDSACASCHREIYERYQQTPMANASGPAGAGFIAGEFTHQASGVHYKVAEDGGRSGSATNEWVVGLLAG